STSIVSAGNHVDLYLFMVDHVIPPQRTVGITGNQVRHLARIRPRDVSRNRPEKQSQPVLAQSLSGWDQCEASWVLVSPTSHKSINMVRVLVMHTSQDPGHMAQAE